MTVGEPRTWLNEAGVSLGDGDREPGPDDRTLARGKLDALARGEIEPGIAMVCALGENRVRAQSLDLQLDQRARRAGSERASATRYRANRRSSRRGSRARTSTPSAWSSRSSIGAPSA